MIYSNLEYLVRAQDEYKSDPRTKEVREAMKSLHIEPDEPCSLWTQYAIDSLLYAVRHGTDRADTIADVYWERYNRELHPTRVIKSAPDWPVADSLAERFTALYESTGNVWYKPTIAKTYNINISSVTHVLSYNSPNNKKKPPNPEVIRRIAEKHGVTEDYLVNGTIPKPEIADLHKAIKELIERTN